MKKFALITLVILGFATAAYAALPLKQMNYILGAKVSESAKGTIVDIPMELRIEASDIEPWKQGSKREIRFKLPQTWVDPPTRIFRQSENEMIKMVKIYQLNKRTAVVSLILRREIPFDEVKVATNFLDDRLRIIVGLNKAEAMAPEAAVVEAVDPPIDLDKIFGETRLGDAYNEKQAENKVNGVHEVVAVASDSSNDPAQSPGAGAPSLATSLVKTIAALVAVIGLILLLAALAKRYLKDSPIFPGASKGRLVRLVSSTPIDAKSRIAVVDVAGEIIVVGVSDGQINMLTKIRNPHSLERINGRPKGKGNIDRSEVVGGSPDISVDADRDGEGSPPQSESENVFHKEFNNRITILQNAVGTEPAMETPPDKDYGVLRAIREKMAGMKKL
jgi:flagellar protein FliO/FliZ